MLSLQRIKDTFWFLPAVLVVGGAVLAQAMIGLDRWADANSMDSIPGAVALGVEGSRGLLTTIGGSVLAVAGTTFSITISVIATASSSYGPRLVRNFMTDRRNQLVLGTFVSTFVYCLMALRTVTGDDSEDGSPAFVPYFAVYLAILLALSNVAALVYFLHHIAQSIQVSHLISRVRNELGDVARRLYGSGIQDRQTRSTAGPEADTIVLADSAGFVVYVNPTALLSAAQDEQGRIDLIAAPGSHVVEGEPLARVRGNDSAALASAVRTNVSLGDARSPYQDVSFAVQQLVEMAVRALSPGTNDPYTARNAIDELGSAMVTIARNPNPPTGWTDSDGMVRLVLPAPSGQTLVDEIFDDLRAYGASDANVVRRSMRLAARMRRVAPPELVERIDTQIDLMLTACADRVAAFDHERLLVDRERIEATP